MPMRPCAGSRNHHHPGFKRRACARPRRRRNHRPAIPASWPRGRHQSRVTVPRCRSRETRPLRISLASLKTVGHATSGRARARARHRRRVRRLHDADLSSVRDQDGVAGGQGRHASVLGMPERPQGLPTDSAGRTIGSLSGDLPGDPRPRLSAIRNARGCKPRELATDGPHISAHEKARA